MIQGFRRWLVTEIGEREASTRVLALVRIGLAIVLLSEWGDALILIRDQRPASIALGIATLLGAMVLLVGFQTRIAALWTAVSVTLVMYVFGHVQDREFFIHHHSHLMMLALWVLAMSPCGASYSVDRWRAVRRGGAVPPERGPVWAQRLLVVLVSTIYVWGVQSKFVPGFLSGARLEQLWMLNLGAPYPTWPLFHPLMLLASWATIALELFLAYGLWDPRLRRYAVAAGIVFHASIYYVLEVSTFSALMYVLYLAAFDPDDVHRTIDELSGVRAGA